MAGFSLQKIDHTGGGVIRVKWLLIFMVYSTFEMRAATQFKIDT